MDRVLGMPGQAHDLMLKSWAGGRRWQGSVVSVLPFDGCLHPRCLSCGALRQPLAQRRARANARARPWTAAGRWHSRRWLWWRHMRSRCGWQREGRVRVVTAAICTRKHMRL